MARKTFLALWAISWALLALVALEAASMVLNHRRGLRQPFLFDLGDGRQSGRIESFSFFDPLLGQARDPATARNARLPYAHGFFVVGDPEDRSALRIVTLGGSTTESGGLPGPWPEQLRELLAAEGVPSVIFNGGVAGYNSDQEMLKLVRDVPGLAPAIVISYDGVNEIRDGRKHGLTYGNPMQERVLALAIAGGSSRLFPNLTALLRRAAGGSGIAGVEYGLPRPLSGAQAWLRNVRIMRGVCRGLGIRYLGVLQPALGVGAYRPSENERRLARRSNLPDKDYPSFYSEARTLARAEEGVADLTEVFRGLHDVFVDDCHVTPEGNAAVANAVLRELRARKLLSGGNRWPK